MVKANLFVKIDYKKRCVGSYEDLACPEIVKDDLEHCLRNFKLFVDISLHMFNEAKIKLHEDKPTRDASYEYLLDFTCEVPTLKYRKIRDSYPKTKFKPLILEGV